MAMESLEFEPCIQCGVRSYVFVTLENFDLSLCLHHWLVNEDVLKPKAVSVRLEPVPA